ncbi:E3 ubiquitin-protein ligase [Lachnellula suecica]|uniref:E3 ubiquitin-protein ligase n=1 Tax=Lachnellula suecica TaxID=602035 RepID=A0A8T9CDI3_9HELO|nr:E3 ubiquitin-protein ligase [Lachnellula suecica]
MNSLKRPVLKAPLDARATPLPSKKQPPSSRLPLPARAASKLRKFLPFHDKSPSESKGKPKGHAHSTPKAGIARAGPPNAMNVIDLTSDDDQDSSQSLSSPDNLYDGDSSDDGILPVRHMVQPARKPQANQQANPFGAADLWGDYALDEDFDDAVIAQAFAQDPVHPAAPRPDTPALQAEPVIDLERQAAQAAVPQGETLDECVAQIMVIFPDVCPDHVSELFNTVSHSSDRIMAFMLDKMEKGSPYPKANDKQKTLKRKRAVSEDEAAALKYGAADRAGPINMALRNYIRSILQVEFPETPMVFIDATINQSHHRLYQAYRILEEAQRTFNQDRPPYNKIKTARKMPSHFREPEVQKFIDAIGSSQPHVEILQELQAARRMRKKEERKQEKELEAEREEKENEQTAIAEGTMQECGCCYCDYPRNRMIHCDTDELHFFCKGCATKMAETEIGNSKYILRCMSMDGCEGGFSADERSKFLDKKTVIALDRNEQEAVLRIAGIENLASCPFCSYAAEYPPVEVNKEFRCIMPDCERVSCRLCELDSHIPKSCEESAKENGLSIRRQIEEAMSAALIRKCNKCGTPFVKEEGCNKMTCTRNGCLNVQCYICSKSCGYDHFDDAGRGGKKGNCPLFESVSERHDAEVSKAEKEALDKVRAEHPEYTEADLKIKLSENVLKDEERRKTKDPRHLHMAHLQAQNQAMLRAAGQ